MVDEPEIRSFKTDQGAQIYQLPLEAFPGFWVYAYLVLVDDRELGTMRVLIDTGSGFGYSNDFLETGLSKASALSNESIGFNDLTHIFITHGHIDHIGGLAFVRPKSRASLGVHELDKRNLTNYEERISIAARRLERFFFEAGVSPERCENLLEAMDDIYCMLATMDFPDAMTGGLRRTTDAVRGILERTRGDLTIALRQQQLEEKLNKLEKKLT